MLTKSQLRKTLRQQRRALSAAQQRAAAARLLEQLLGVEDFCRGQRVALYLAQDGEIDPVEVKHWLWQHHKQCYVPVVPPPSKMRLTFAELTPQSTLQANRFGIAEPRAAVPIDAAQLDVVLLPLVGFDPSGNRIGMGGGYYDATFEFVKQRGATRPTMIGLAHEIQRVATVDAAAWDIPLDTVVSDAAVYACAPRAQG